MARNVLRARELRALIGEGQREGEKEGAQGQKEGSSKEEDRKY